MVGAFVATAVLCVDATIPGSEILGRSRCSFGLKRRAFLCWPGAGTIGFFGQVAVTLDLLLRLMTPRVVQA